MHGEVASLLEGVQAHRTLERSFCTVSAQMVREANPMRKRGVAHLTLEGPLLQGPVAAKVLHKAGLVGEGFRTKATVELRPACFLPRAVMMIGDVRWASCRRNALSLFG